MPHIAEGTLRGLLDGELLPDARARAEAHLAGCAACATDLAEVRAESERASALLGMAAAHPPTATAQAAFARRRLGRRVVRAGSGLARAAALVMLMAGAVSAAVPGSPVRALLRDLLGTPEPAVESAPVPAAEPVRAAPAAPPATGVSIAPEGGRVRVVLSGAAPELRVRARLTGDPRAAVSASGAASGARFRTAPGRIEVVDARGGEVLIELPARATSAYLEVNGRIYLAKQGERLRALVPATGGTEAEPVFRVGG